jgi:pyruvate dehydrogenase E2 component (dihydrolipoamide acetyltransferase)
MAIVINMPRLSDTMTEGVVAKWHKKVGDTITEGDLLAEIETDKATMEFESFPGQEGTLLYIGVDEGKSAPVDQVLAILGEEGEDIEALKKGGAPAEEEKEEESKSEETKPEPKKEMPAPQAAASPAPATSAPTTSGNGRVMASPLAKKMAEEKGIDISAVRGSGDNGRVIKRDIENYVPAAAPAFAAPAIGGDQTAVDTEVSQMRKTIARRLAESKFSAPHFYLTMEIDMDNAVAARKQVNTAGDVKISFNDIVIKAVAMALRKHPKVNSSWLGDTIRQYNYINVGVAVAVDEGLLVPVIRNADLKGMAQISAEVRELAAKAKDKKLQPEEWEGNTFTISNLGMFGIDEFTAIINPPDACILAVGGIKQVPVVKDGAVVPGNLMKVTLSCDHRVVDGATGAAFLQTVKANLENPVNMLV